MSKFIFFSIVALFSQVAFAAKDVDCIDGKIRYLENGKEKIVNETYCYDTFLKKIYSSGRCKPNTKCLADVPAPIIVKWDEISSPKGSPGFKICTKLSGVPQIMEYWDLEKWVKTARCVFKDASYIDIGTLATKVQYEGSKVKTAPKKADKK